MSDKKRTDNDNAPAGVETEIAKEIAAAEWKRLMVLRDKALQGMVTLRKLHGDTVH